MDMEKITTSKLHKCFYQAVKDRTSYEIFNNDGESIGYLFWKTGTCASRLDKVAIELENGENVGTCASGLAEVAIEEPEVKMKTWTLEELIAKFPAKKAEVPVETELEHKPSCRKCGRESEGWIEEVTAENGWEKFEVCGVCAKKYKLKLNRWMK